MAQEHEMVAEQGSFPAHKYSRGGISVFVVAMPLEAVTELLPIPDPALKFPGNRRVDLVHAEEFARYWQENKRWATPPLLIDTELCLRDNFTEHAAVGPIASGILRFPRDTPAAFEILDGQHRILGWHLVAVRIDGELSSARTALQHAHALGDAAARRAAEVDVIRWNGLAARFASECVTLEVFEGVGLEEHKQFFSDIATNAKGITKSQIAAFDQRDLVNRVAAEIAMKHPLVEGIVDFEKDRMTGNSPHLLSAKTLVDVVRATAAGFDSRATRKREALLDAAEVRDVTLRFLDVLIEEVPGLSDVASGATSAAELRAKSLIASATVVRCLASAFRIVAVNGINELRPTVDLHGEQQFRALLRRLAYSWGFPVDQVWLATGYFPHSASRAPSSRAQDLKGLATTIAAWANQDGPILHEALQSWDFESSHAYVHTTSG